VAASAAAWRAACAAAATDGRSFTRASQSASRVHGFGPLPKPTEPFTKGATHRSPIPNSVPLSQRRPSKVGLEPGLERRRLRRGARDETLRELALRAAEGQHLGEPPVEG
jgi:hypothetical protein